MGAAMAEIIERTCIVCGGSGEFSNGKPCRACDGEGSHVFFKPYPKEEIENIASPKSDGEILHETYDGNGRRRDKGSFC